MYWFMVLVFNLLVGLAFITGNLYFFFIYKLDLPFFEKYKSVDEPWPWQTDDYEWNKLFWRSVYFTAINLTIVPFLFSLTFSFKTEPVPFSYDDKLPSIPVIIA